MAQFVIEVSLPELLRRVEPVTDGACRAVGSQGEMEDGWAQELRLFPLLRSTHWPILLKQSQYKGNLLGDGGHRLKYLHLSLSLRSLWQV
jgi:hypothetical protein